VNFGHLVVRPVLDTFRPAFLPLRLAVQGNAHIIHGLRGVQECR
jgi:hypothetical protein